MSTNEHTSSRRVSLVVPNNMEELRPAKKARFDGGLNGRKDRQAGKWAAQKSRSSGNANISASGIQSGDVGIFVTCDKGMEKRCLRELEDLLVDYMDLEGTTSGVYTKNEATIGEAVEAGDRGDVPGNIEEVDIENDVLAELAEMRDSQSGPGPAASRPTQKGLRLVTLDIPCVSFVCFPSASTVTKNHDPLSIVHKICTDAAASPDRPRSRFIKRLTPISKVRKVMNSGIEQLCDEVLPVHFGCEQEQEPQQRWKYAIRPTIRNNNQVNRDMTIKLIAEKVDALGEHKVDLKGYDKLVLVDVYRNICGMSVVGQDYEALKRYNLAEIYTAGMVAEEANRMKDREAVVLGFNDGDAMESVRDR